MDLKSILGYSQGSPFAGNPYLDIQGNNITMENTDIPLLLQPIKNGKKSGKAKIGIPLDKNPYIFSSADSVMEIPILHNGGSLSNILNFLNEDDSEFDNSEFSNDIKNQQFEERMNFANPYIQNNKDTKGSKAQYAFDFFKSRGLQAHQAAGIVNNLIQESGNFRDDVIKFKTTGDNNLKDKGYGIAQWRGNRVKDLMNFANNNSLSPYDLNTQLLFVENESKKRGDWQKLLNTRNIEEATHSFNYNYEVSADSRNSKLRNIRLKHTNKYNIWE